MPFCGMCATEHEAGAQFCVSCGARTAAAAAAPHRPAGPAGSEQPATWATTLPSFDSRAVSGAVHALVGDFQQLPIRTLVPLRAWWEARVWQQPWAALFLIAAITPFLLLHLGGDPARFHQVSWGFSLYFAFIWFIALFVLIRPEQLDWQLLGKVALFTAFLGVALALSLEKHLAGGQMNVVKYVLGVGLPEELAKAVAVYLFVFRSGRDSSLRTFLFVGAVSGLAFGAAEAVSYSTLFAQTLPFASNASTAVIAEIWRLLTDSLFHACLAGITAFFFGLAYRSKSAAVALIGFGLAFAGLLHGLYDNFANGWLGAFLAIIIVLIFVGYVATCDQIGAQFHQHSSPKPQPVAAQPPDAWANRTWASHSTPAPAPVEPPTSAAGAPAAVAPGGG